MNADDQRKYGLRLNDVVTIVEGSLARQQTEMKRLQDAAMTLRLECDAARVAENQTKSLYEAALARLNMLQAQNEQLRSMVLTLLNVIEGREAPSALQAVVQRLESTVHDTHETQPTTPASPLPAPAAENAPAEAAAQDAAAEEPVAEPAANAEAETVALGDQEELEELAEEDAASPAVELAAAGDIAETTEAPLEEVMAETQEDTSASMAAFDDATGSSEADTSAEMIDAVDEDLEAESSDIAAAAEDMPEDLDEISLNGHREFVTDADEIVANEALVDAVVAPEPVAEAEAQPAPQQDETLVSALLDAEKALIEAGASGVANANSPVAEIIRRISLRTREFSEASGV